MAKQLTVAIIGSGAGGAPIAHTLAKTNARVVMFEKGPLFDTQQYDSAGRLIRFSDFKRDELFATGSEKRITHGVANRGESFYASHVEPDLNDEPHVYRGVDGRDRVTIEGYTAQVIGGGTQLYGAVSLRFSPTDFKLSTFNNERTDLVDDPDQDIRREARDWPISYDELLPYYEMAEELIGINGSVGINGVVTQAKSFPAMCTKTTRPNPISRFAADGMDALGMKRYRTPLAVITENHPLSGRIVPLNTDLVKTGYVNRYGDPMGYKSNTWVALLKPMLGRDNFDLRCNSVVTHLTSVGSKVTRVHYRDAGGARQVLDDVDMVVVACSAIESVRLLMLSSLEDQGGFGARINQNNLLGKYFLTHCFGGAETIVPGRFDKSLSLDSDWATDHCATENFIRANRLWAGGAIYNNTSDQALPLSLVRTHGSQDMDTVWKTFANDFDLTGQGFADFIDANFGTRLSVSFMANQIPLKTNRIELHPTLKDKWGRPCAYIIKNWHAHDKRLMDILAEQCARILEMGVSKGKGGFVVRDKGGVYQAENGIARIANHILGGARFGRERDDSVLDVYCKAWEFNNLYVTDGAFMPTSGGANPTLTIQANAFRVGEYLRKQVQ